MEKFNITFWEALKKINKDFLLNLKIEEFAKKEVIIPPKESKIIQIEIKPFSDFELTYWKQFGITKTDLENSKVLYGVKIVSVDKVYVDKKFTSRSTEQNPIFGYVYPSGRIKLYRPLSKEKDKKWFGNATREDINGKLDFINDVVIITKSLKDVIVLSKLGYETIAPQSEGSDFKDGFVGSIIANANHVIVFFDNDGKENPEKGESGKGKEMAKNFSEKYNIPRIFLPDGEAKDISDYYKVNGKKKTKEILQKLITQCIAKNAIEIEE